jgi:hypothetical protein
MKQIVAIFELEGFTQKNYDDIVEELKASGGFPDERRISHAAFQKGPNWCVVDVWKSADDLMDFGKERLFPIFEKLGLKPNPPQIYPVHHFVGSRVAEEFYA